jgi:hypothetical protein
MGIYHASLIFYQQYAAPTIINKMNNTTIKAKPELCEWPIFITSLISFLDIICKVKGNWD